MIWTAATPFGGYTLTATGESRDEALEVLCEGYRKWSRQRGGPEPPSFAEWCEGGEVSCEPVAVGVCTLDSGGVYAGELPADWPEPSGVTRQDGERAEAVIDS